MSLPRFLERALDAAVPALGGIDRAAVRAKLEGTVVRLRFGATVPESTAGTGALLAANLFSRLYPQIALNGCDPMVTVAQERILVVNPDCEILTDLRQDAITLAFESGARPDERTVTVAARGWNVYVDTDPTGGAKPAAPAALTAACLGVAEVFRMVFADELGMRGRRGPQPGTLNLVAFDDTEVDLPVPESVAVPRMRLVGAGAIGQAAALTLSAAGLEGTIIATDPERVALSNLQRYVLTEDADVERVKVELLDERIGSERLRVDGQPRQWDAALAREPLPTLTALDTPEDRIAVQASLPVRSTTRSRSQQTSAGRGTRRSAKRPAWPVSTGPIMSGRGGTSRSPRPSRCTRCASWPTCCIGCRSACHCRQAAPRRCQTWSSRPSCPRGSRARCCRTLPPALAWRRKSWPPGASSR